MVENTHQSLQLKWLPLQGRAMGGAPDFHYQISYYLSELGIANTTNVRVEKLQNSALDKYQNYTLNGLLPKRTYDVSIRAINQLGRGKERSTFATTKPVPGTSTF